MAFDYKKLEKYVPLALVVGGIGILVYLIQQQDFVPAQNPDGSPNPDAVPTAQSLAPTYPNAGIIPPGTVELGGSPLYLTYNTPNPPDDPVVVGGNGNDGATCECGQGTLALQQTVSPSGLAAEIANIQSLFNNAKIS